MHKRGKIGFLFLLVISGLLFIIFTGCSFFPEEEEALAPPLVKPKKVEYEVYKVVKKDITKTLKSRGTLVSVKDKALSFNESGGKLGSIEVKTGQEVKRGTILVTLHVGNLDSQIRLQHNTIQKIELQRERQIKKYEQYMGLPADSQPPRNELEDMLTNLKLMDLDLDTAKIGLEDLETKRSNSILVSPADGIVTFIEDMKAGDTIEAYKTIVTVADPGELQLYHQADDVDEIKTGMKASVTYKGSQYSGSVVLSPDNVPKDAGAKWKNAILINIENLPAGVLWGEDLEFAIDLQKKNQVVVVPRKCLNRELGRTYVQVMEDGSKKDQDVEVGITTPFDVEILSGLAEGQMLIVN
jgi:membrane fusion protein, macrolide-specific efflux system